MPIPKTCLAFFAFVATALHAGSSEVANIPEIGAHQPVLIVEKNVNNRTRASSWERLLCKVKTWSWPDSDARRVRSTESATLCTRCKTGGGVQGCFANWSVACQVLFN
jgi:hypothetical protein